MNSTQSRRGRVYACDSTLPPKYHLVATSSLSQIYSFWSFNHFFYPCIYNQPIQAVPIFFPLKSNAQLQLLGCGFWESSKAIAKFSRAGYQGFQAPARSTPAVFVDEGEMKCRPPKLAEAGEYDISLALNGIDFTLETVRVCVYADPVLDSFHPRLVDMRQTTRPIEVLLVSDVWMEILMKFCKRHISFKSMIVKLVCNFIMFSKSILYDVYW